MAFCSEPRPPTPLSLTQLSSRGAHKNWQHLCLLAWLGHGGQLVSDRSALHVGWEAPSFKRLAAVQLRKVCRDAALAIQVLLLWCLVRLLLRRRLQCCHGPLLHKLRLQGGLLDRHNASGCGSKRAVSQLLGRQRILCFHRHPWRCKRQLCATKSRKQVPGISWLLLHLLLIHRPQLHLLELRLLHLCMRVLWLATRRHVAGAAQGWVH